MGYKWNFSDNGYRKKKIFSVDDKMTTAIYPNRLADKEKVERVVGLREDGDNITVFYDRKGNTFARGYNRVVYGDHGPYVEFEWKHIDAILVPKFKISSDPKLYYEWLMPIEDTNIKVYKQLRTVTHLPNPPKGWFKGNRKGGYADYKVGMLYVSVGDFTKIATG